MLLKFYCFAHILNDNNNFLNFSFWTHCCQWRRKVVLIWVNIDCNGLFPDRLLTDGTKSLPETMLTYLQSSDNYQRVIVQKIAQPLIAKIVLKIETLKFYSNHRGANELNT